MAKKKLTAADERGAGEAMPAGDPLLPTVGVPGTFEWCEEVVECMVSAWRAREHSEQGFIAAVRAAVNYRIWETLSPPPPQEPYTSLENLIRRTADAGQAENMQLVVKFSGVLDEAERSADAPPWETAGTVAARGARSPEARASYADAESGSEAGLDPEVALGEALLAQFAAQLGVSLNEGDDTSGRPVGIPAGVPSSAYAGGGGGSAASAQPRVSAAQRKRERLERTHPELVDAVEAGEMTLKQAYVEAGIEKEVRMIDKLQKLWRAASEEERERFLSWLDEQIAQQRKQTYQEEVYGDDA